MSLDKTWFTEISEESASAFSLKIKEKLHTEKTSFQTIDIYATEEYGNLMVIDGFIMVTDRDNAIYHEMISHPALFTHKKAEKIAIIGGGDCGTLKEVLKHESVKSATLIEIDEQVTLLAKKYFPSLTHVLNDERATVLHEDAAEWIKQASHYDIIIVDSTDPVGPAIELFTQDFYRSCLNALNENGILVQQSESPLFHMNILKPMQQAMVEAGFTNTQTLHFFQSSYPSGWWTTTMAGKNIKNLTKFERSKSEQKSFETFYYNAEIHQAAFASPEFVKRELASSNE